MGKPADPTHRALESETESRVNEGSVASQIQVPGIRFLRQSLLLNPGDQQIQVILALTAADDFPDAGRQHVQCRHCPLVVAEPHVERLEVEREVGDNDRLLDGDFGEVTLVLGLEI